VSNAQTQIMTHVVETPSGRISYASAGFGLVAPFVHGVVLNKHLWRRQLAGLSDIRRYIAVDLLAHGNTEITPEQDGTIGKAVLSDLLLSTALAACTVGPDYTPPQTEPAPFHNMADGFVRLANTGPAWQPSHHDDLA
jgi:hypothetical protein